MNADEALKLAEEHIAVDMVVLAETVRECRFGFYFGTDTRKHQQSGRWEDLAAPGGVWLSRDRNSYVLSES